MLALYKSMSCGCPSYYKREILYFVLTLKMSLQSRTTFIFCITTITLITALQAEYLQRFRISQKYLDQKQFQDSHYEQRRPDENFNPIDLSFPFSTIVVRRSRRRNEDIDHNNNNPHKTQHAPYYQDPYRCRRQF